MITNIYELKTNNEKLITPSDTEIVDATNLLIFPGLIDCHVHFREPGNTEAEDMESGAASAIAGGVTTVCDMPNTNPPTCTRKALEDKIERAKRIEGCDIRFFFGVTEMDHLKELEGVDLNDICGVKLYFCHSTGNQKADESVIEETFKLCKKMGLTVVCHCEDAEINANDPSRPPESEKVAIERAIELTKKHGTKLHIAHISTSQGVNLVKRAKSEGLPVTCEAAPHHLFMTVDDFEKLGSLAKMNPPLRTADHVEALWVGIGDGTIDCVASDHAPHTLEAKGFCRGVWPNAPTKTTPAGVPGTETMLPLLLSCMNEGPHDSDKSSRKPSIKMSPKDILRLLFTNPNKIFDLGLSAVAPKERRPGKPGVQVGKPTDLTLVNPSQTWQIHGEELKSKCGWTPYEGWEVTGRVVSF